MAYHPVPIYRRRRWWVGLADSGKALAAASFEKSWGNAGDSWVFSRPAHEPVDQPGCVRVVACERFANARRHGCGDDRAAAGAECRSEQHHALVVMELGVDPLLQVGPLHAGRGERDVGVVPQRLLGVWRRRRLVCARRGEGVGSRCLLEGTRRSQGKSIDIQLTEAGILEWPSHAGFLGSATVWPHSFHQMSASGKAPRIVSAATLRLL